ncbi:hypothetical protein AB0H42_02080 [Nocardia sp. NPDC050799]|uniref:hypothetical protein n=1 Tax=Nocardia sp. NPDC050799 TaxID=3154842 RepID=UPI0033D1E188
MIRQARREREPLCITLYEEARGLFTTIHSAVRRVREADRGVERWCRGVAQSYSRPDRDLPAGDGRRTSENYVVVPDNRWARRVRRVREFAQTAAAVLRKAGEEKNIP